MKSLKDFLIMGPGPSSSHTIGPYRIANMFKSLLSQKKVKHIDVILFGSLALTGKGHSTDRIIREALEGYDLEILFDCKTKDIPHPNTMRLIAHLDDSSTIDKTYLSVGGGYVIENGQEDKQNDIYPFSTFAGLSEFMEKSNITDIYEVISRFEDSDILDYAKNLLLHSFETIGKALKDKSILPGPLKLHSVSGEIYVRAKECIDPTEKRLLLLSSYAYATSESNARGETVVTAPTCGAAGVVPAVLYYEYKDCGCDLNELVKAYLVGALVCDFIKENASVSGAKSGCQAEIGSAASFASASLSYLHHLSLHQIEYAAEVAMEHFLGLTCDPVDGFVQIPCIERNGIAAIHSYSAYLYAKCISPLRKNRVSFDNVIKAMKETGDSLPSELKETSLGGLAKIINC